MTRKDYILLAEVLRVARYNAELDLDDKNASPERKSYFQGKLAAIDELTLSLEDSLKRDNARFNCNHFTDVVLRIKSLESRPKRAIA